MQPRHELLYTIGDSPHHLTLFGTPHWGAPSCLFDEEDNIVHRQPWNREGYTTTAFFSATEFDQLKQFATGIVRHKIPHAPTAFTLDKYHETVTDDILHTRVVGHNNLCMNVKALPCLPLLQSRVSQLLGRPLQATNPHTGHGEFSIRLVRPFRLDYNPPHKDVWIGRLRRGVNLYIPLAASDEHSSLALLPQSHHWKESNFQYTLGGARTEAYHFCVPGLIALSHHRPITLIRPNPAYGECLLFSPYMIHGGASNCNPHTTRASLEIRFWEKR